jgi:hypothetical protein
MRRYGFALVLAVIALMVVAWATSASAISSPQTFSLLAVSSQDHPMNGFAFQREPRGGDQFGFTETLYKWAGNKRGARVGRVEGMGTFIAVGANGGSQMTVAQAYLKGGSILAQGFFKFPNGPSKFTLPVVGGTGTYANVRGYVNVRDLLGRGNQGKQNVDFHLLP